MPGALTAFADNKPVGFEEFAALLQNVSIPSSKIAVAVSGGADSMALAFCAQRWAKQNDKTCFAFIVDHGLRAESADEAAQVKQRLESFGLPVEILKWRHELSHAGHEKARDARYHLLEEACRRHGINDLWVAHHREDQVETILMRLSKGSGVEGLAGMSPESKRDGIRLLRPFLGLSKQRLIATCAAEKIDYVADPSNESEKYARGRLRKIMPLLASEGLTVDRLNDLGARAAEVRDALDFYTTEFLKSAAATEIGGAVRLNRLSLGAAPRAIAMRALSACLRYVYDGDHPPERATLSSLLDAIIDAGSDETRTFYGCLISLAPRDAIILREPGAVTETLIFIPGAKILWDRRWRVSGSPDAAGAPLTLRALGNPPHDEIDRLAPYLRHLVPQGRIRATLPALWAGERLCAIPSFDEKSGFRLMYKKETFP